MTKKLHDGAVVKCMRACLATAILAAPAVAQTPGETVLYAFQGGTDGANDNAGLVVGPNGVIYGTTRDGGAGTCTDYWSNGQVVGCGTIFQLTPPTGGSGPWTETILYSFAGGSDGAFPSTLTINSKTGVLYGSTGNGGIGATLGVGGGGVVFQLSPPKSSGGAWKETVLYSFCNQPNCTDGAAGGDGLLLSGGSLYGTTDYGGASGNGTVFQVKLPTATSRAKFTSLYSFKGGTDGAVPFFGVIAGKSGVLYGVTSAGGGTGCANNSGCGTVYQLTPPTVSGGAYTETVLYAFSGTDGANPTGRMNLLGGGVLLGVCGGGGSTGYGTVFELTPPATTGPWTLTTLSTFGEGNLYGFPDSSYPNGNLVVGTNGSIYGTSFGGGDTNTQIGFFYPGTIFELTPPLSKGGPWVRSILYSFQAGTDGALPGWGLIEGPTGTLLGTTAVGGGSGCPAQGSIGCGTVFQLTL
jgi:uncharacterized repeat protein (TIGR03803 family)